MWLRASGAVSSLADEHIGVVHFRVKISVGDNGGQILRYFIWSSAISKTKYQVGLNYSA
jgi:hypothetical protein